MMTLDDKIKSIQHYMVDKFNDAMLRDYNIYFIRRFTGDPIGGSMLYAQFYYSEELRKIYLYFAMDKSNRWGRHDLVKNMYKSITNEVYEYTGPEIDCKVQLLGPSAIAANKKNNSASIISRHITPHTITYWIGTNGQFEFINDPVITVNHKYQKFFADNRIKNKDNWIDNLNQEIAEINSNYDFIHNPLDIPTAFEEYKTIYKNITGFDLPDYNPITDINKIYMLNKTDYGV